MCALTGRSDAITEGPTAAFGKFLLGQNTQAAGTTSDLPAVDLPAVDLPAVDLPASSLCRTSQNFPQPQ